MSIHLARNLDIMLSDTMVINAGIGVNVYDGLIRNEDIAMSLALVASLHAIGTPIGFIAVGKIKALNFRVEGLIFFSTDSS